MLDIRFIRENIELVRNNLQRRRDTEKLEEFERLLSLDQRIRKLRKEIQELRTQRNRLSKEVGQLKKAGKDASKIMNEVNKVNKELSKTEQDADSQSAELLKIQMSIPNILHNSVPFGEGEEDNDITSEWGGKPTRNFEVQSHVDLLESLALADIHRASKIAGTRMYFLKNELVMIDLAMQQLALTMLIERDFTPM